MVIVSFPLGPAQTNCYALSTGRLGAIVDPGPNPAPVLGYLEETGIRVGHILLTHLHWDHIHGVAEIQDATGAVVLANPRDAFLTREAVGRGTGRGVPPVPDFDFQSLEPGKTSFFGEPCIVLDTPGHSPGGLSFFFPLAGAVFPGDLIFHRSVGRTNLPGGDTKQLFRSIRERIFILPGDTEIHPGHGPMTTVAEEMLNNPFIQEIREN